MIVPSDAAALLSQAVAAGASIDTLERLMALRKEMLAEKAKEAFNTAMAAFQSECPVIAKSKSVDNKYKYAPIESIVSQVKDLIKTHGFRYSTTMELNEARDLVKVFCRVVHTLGHEEISVMEVPLGSKTAIMSQSQQVAAASTFAKRYAFLNAFGIMTGDEDNDAAPPKEELKPPRQSTPPAAPAKHAPVEKPKSDVPPPKLPPTKENFIKVMKAQKFIKPLVMTYEKAMTDEAWNVDDGNTLTETFLFKYATIERWMKYGDNFKTPDGKLVAKITRTKLDNLNVKASVVEAPTEAEVVDAEDKARKAS